MDKKYIIGAIVAVIAIVAVAAFALGGGHTEHGGRRQGSRRQDRLSVDGLCLRRTGHEAVEAG